MKLLFKALLLIAAGLFFGAVAVTLLTPFEPAIGFAFALIGLSGLCLVLALGLAALMTKLEDRS